MEPNIKQSIIDRLKQSNNVLVTVKNSPTVDLLAACIGLTLFLNKQGKHTTAVFSGEVPSTLEFLKPDATLEKDTNSLRDFIIALDKNKADKLRYKVEDKVVRIFITPYKTSINQDDLNFSLGDFNVDVVVALGVHGREELDQAIMAHGRILHDATIISINNNKPADLGALNWNDSKSSSLSEMATSLIEGLQPELLDAQISTALLTGIVAETERFRNSKTSSATMNISAKLMSAGANQQLVASKLEEPVKIPQPTKPTDGNGTLEINHPKVEPNHIKPENNTPKDSIKRIEPLHKIDKSGTDFNMPGFNKDSEDDIEEDFDTIELPPPAATDGLRGDGEIFIDENGNFKTGLQDQQPEDDKPNSSEPSRMALEPPTLGGDLSANTHVNRLDPSIDPLSASPQNSHSILSHGEPQANNNANHVTGKGIDIKPTQTLSSIEEQLDSPHLDEVSTLNMQENDAFAQKDDQTISQLEAEKSSRYNNQDKQADNLPNQDETAEVEDLDEARKAVESASRSFSNQPLEPLQSINSQPLGEELHSNQDDNSNSTKSNQPSPPSVPPPMMPPSY